MQSLKSERAKKEYEQFVKEVTPKQNLFCNMAKAFIVGGLICVVGQILLHIGKTQFSLSKDDAGSWCSLILILSSVILTGLNIYQKIVTFAGCGALVPITGFANSVAAPAIEYKKEGQVFGIGAKIFTIAGPVILYGVFASWLLGFLYWLGLQPLQHLRSGKGVLIGVHDLPALEHPAQGGKIPVGHLPQRQAVGLQDILSHLPAPPLSAPPGFRLRSAGIFRLF